MKIFNTLTRKIEEFHPIRKGKIKMFVCGPTVYDEIHVGNGRTFVLFDSFAKYLRFKGYLLFYVQNITDVDDKIIDKAKDENVAFSTISERYLNIFMNYMERLRVESVSLYAPASLFIDEIISQIRRLIRRGYAYRGDDGIYFSVSKFDDYGSLSGQKLDNLIPGVRKSVTSSKKNFQDFALWKDKKPGEPWWSAPWSKGRPGWHIEDTAITEYFFGYTYDIHGGGSDLIFPHHEAEIAQMRSISGRKTYARYWMHTGMVNMASEKMSKSVGNIVKIGDVLSRFKPEDLRFFYLNSNYRNVLDFSMDLLEESSTARMRIQNLYRKLGDTSEFTGNHNIELGSIRKKFLSHLDHDFDTRSALREVLHLTSVAFSSIDRLSPASAEEIRRFLMEVDSIFGIISPEKREGNLSRILSGIIAYREELRRARKFDESDRLRSLLREAGISLEDRAGKTEWSVIE